MSNPTTTPSPRILVTNDDGITAPGLRHLVEVAQRFGTVTVVAPDSPQSGQGHAITLNDPLRLRENDFGPGVTAYECSGTPVDCVKLAKSVLFLDNPPDLCLSGINHGSNAGINILYSGTMSAAMEASLEGVPSIGFSFLDYTWDADFTPALPYVAQIVAGVLERGLQETLLLNVNLPTGQETPIRGIRVCHQAEGRWRERYAEMENPRGQKVYWLTGDFTMQDTSPEADVNALAAGYVSVVPSRHDLTAYRAMRGLQWLEKTSE